MATASTTTWKRKVYLDSVSSLATASTQISDHNKAKCCNPPIDPLPPITTTPTPPTANYISSHQAQDNDYLLSSTSHESLARAETRVANCLRASVILVLLLTGILVSTGVYVYTRNEEVANFEIRFRDDANQVIDSFHHFVERNIGSSARMATAITSYALHSNLTFPFVTVPDFELHGSHLRAQSGSHIVHYMPIVTEDKRLEWEDYALKNRDQIDTAFNNDMYFRTQQDRLFGLGEHDKIRNLAGDSGTNGDKPTSEQATNPNGMLNTTILGDNTGYHPRIWRNPSVSIPGDEPHGEGPYVPAWQRSPIDGSKQGFLNMNWAKTKVFPPNAVTKMMNEQKAILSNAAIPIPEFKAKLEQNLGLSQYRERVSDLIDGLTTFVLYPIFDSFSDTRKVAGLLATSVYWEVLFSNLLPSGTQGLLCVVENTPFNQTFTYRIDAQSKAHFVGMGDHHDSHFDGLEVSANVNEYLAQKGGPENRAYPTVPLSDDSHYLIRIYPSKTTQDQFLTNEPVLYTLAVISGFAFASVLFILFSCVVDKRQRIMMDKVVENARRAAVAERELNEFLSHEVRNPLSAAISACSFVSAAVNEDKPMMDEETKKFVREDIEVVNSSLHFINDFLRSMLDIHRDNKQIRVQMAPTDLLRDVLEPVSAILYKRVASFQVIVDCPENLMVMTDSIRLKQVVLNLVRNSSKFVEKGFLRMRVDVKEHCVKVYVEDSGPGISPQKLQELFAKYQQSLDLLSQGTGIGLNLSKKLMHALGGNLYLDSSYNSGIVGYPGASFVVDLNTAPLDLESTFVASDLVEASQCRSTDSMPDVETGMILDSDKQGSTPESLASTTRPLEESKKEAAPPLLSVAALPEDTKPLLPQDLSVLFVDDDAVLRKLFVRAVKRVLPNCRIQEASSGETALRICEVETFDIIFLDQYMASVDKQLLGTETATTMRRKGIESKICGLSANDLRDAFINSGADEFLMKPLPCKIGELEEMLCHLLEGRPRLRDSSCTYLVKAS